MRIFFYILLFRIIMGGAKKRKRKSKNAGRPRKKRRIYNNINIGRTRKNIFNPDEQVSYKTLQRRASELAKECNNNVQLLELALKAAKKATETPEECDSKIVEDESNLIHTKESALAFHLEYNFSEYQYRGLQMDTKARKSSIYPSYWEILEAKKGIICEIAHMSETEVRVSLQSILNKTSERLSEAVALKWDEDKLRNLEMSVSLGFDSSAGHLSPHQKSKQHHEDFTTAQQSLFTTSFTVIQLASDSDDNCVWLNPTPLSVRFTRPLRMSFEKEDDNAIISENARLNEEIQFLNKHRFQLSNGKHVRIKYVVTKTLFDGKCVNTLTGNPATSRCPICLHTAHEFGNLENDFSPNEDAPSYGLGLLHAEIKMFEHLKNISYRLPLQKWDVTANLKGKVYLNYYARWALLFFR